MLELALKVYRSPTEFRTETYRQPRVTVGREINNDIVLPNREISRFHCLFECDEKGWRVVDLESTNGTFVNGICLKQMPIKPEDVVVVGPIRIHVQKCSVDASAATALLGGYRILQTLDGRVMVAEARKLTSAQLTPPTDPDLVRALSDEPRYSKTPGLVLLADEIRTGARDPTALAQTVAERVHALVDADLCGVFLRQGPEGSVQLLAAHPLGQTVVVPAEILQYAQENTVSINTQIDERSSGVDGRPLGILCAPMLDGSEALGAIALLRRHTTWKPGDHDLEALAISALAAGAAFGCGRSYRQMEKAYFDLLEAGETLPGPLGDRQMDEAERVSLESAAQELRSQLAALMEKTERLTGGAVSDAATTQSLAELAEAAQRADQTALRLTHLLAPPSTAASTTQPEELLSDLLPLLREIAGAGTTIEERVADSLPAVVVSPHLMRAALVRIVWFCREQVRATRLTLTAEQRGLEQPLAVEGAEPIPPGQYVRIAIEAEGGNTSAIEQIKDLDHETGPLPRDLRSSTAGLFRAAFMLRRAGSQMVVRAVRSDILIFDVLVRVLGEQ